MVSSRGFALFIQLTFLADRLRANVDDGLCTGMILIYLQKAFDTVDYTILKKLSAIAVAVSALSWFNSYVAGKKQVHAGTTWFHFGSAALHYILLVGLPVFVRDSGIIFIHNGAFNFLLFRSW